MSEVKRRLHDRISDPSYLEGLTTRAVTELHEMRNECGEAENEVSFERRLCHARIDILTAELDRRSGKEEGDLLSRLPEILASDVSTQSDSPLPPRARDFSIPRNTDVPRRRVEEIVGEQTLARLSQVPTGEIKGIIESLAAHEKTLSERRRRIHDLLDEIQAEIVRRYTEGEADPNEALS
jgi:hypothetical protein